MAGAAGASNGGRNAEREVRDSAGENVPKTLLDEIIHDAAHSAIDATLDERLARELALVAARYPDAPLEHEEVAPALVMAAFRVQFEKFHVEPPRWPALARDLAAVLLADPVAQTRLNRLWTSLRKGHA